MRILFVAMPDSIHTARWISLLKNRGWNIYLFPAYIGQPHPNIDDISVFASVLSHVRNKRNQVRFIWWTLPFFWLDRILSKVYRTSTNSFTKKALSCVVDWLKPDIVHSLEIQHAGYLVDDVRKILKKEIPAWIVTNWGSDIYLFGRLKEHKQKIIDILSNCDYYSCECKRDIAIAKELGLRGTVLPIFPNTGGFDLEKASKLGTIKLPASRKWILLKGYQNWSGRALVGIQALRYCLELLENYSIAISVADPEVRLAAELFSQDTKIPVEIIPPVSHDEMLSYYGRSRIYVGLSISDGISTSLLEAMVMGAFPIQSCTACANEWIENGKSGFIVPPEDPHAIANAIRHALVDDILVNQAADINMKTARERLDNTGIQPQVINMYQNIFETLKVRN